MTNKLLTTIALSASLLFLNSCKKDNDDDGPVQPANFMVVNASPGSSAVELYLDNVKASTTPIAYSSGSAYATIDPKQYNIKLAAVNTINALAETSVNLNAGGYFSIFAYDTLVNNKIKVFTVEDDLSAPAGGKAKIRFLHLSPQASNLAIDVLANNNKIFSSRSYADNVSDGNKAAFVQVDAGTYTVDVVIAGSSIPLLKAPGVVVEAGKIYTLIAKGKLQGTGEQALGAQLIVNK